MCNAREPTTRICERLIRRQKRKVQDKVDIVAEDAGHWCWYVSRCWWHRSDWEDCITTDYSLLYRFHQQADQTAVSHAVGCGQSMALSVELSTNGWKITRDISAQYCTVISSNNFHWLMNARLWYLLIVKLLIECIYSKFLWIWKYSAQEYFLVELISNKGCFKN